MKSIKIFGSAPDFGFGHSTELSTGIIQTEGDTNILFTHSRL